MYDVDAARAGGTDRIDLTQQDFGGTCDCTLHDICSTTDGKLILSLSDEFVDKEEGTLNITARILQSSANSHALSPASSPSSSPTKNAKNNFSSMEAVTKRRLERVRLDALLRLYTIGCMFVLSHVDTMPITLYVQNLKIMKK